MGIRRTKQGELSRAIEEVLGVRYPELGCSRETLMEALPEFSKKGFGNTLASMVKGGRIKKDEITGNYRLTEGYVFEEVNKVIKEHKEKEQIKEAVNGMKPREIAELVVFLWEEVKRLNKVNEEWKDAWERMWNSAKEAREYKQRREGWEECDKIYTKRG